MIRDGQYYENSLQTAVTVSTEQNTGNKGTRHTHAEKSLLKLMPNTANKASWNKTHRRLKISRKQRNWHISGIVYFSHAGSHAGHIPRSYVLFRNLSVWCLDADGPYLHTAQMSGGSGLQFIKAVILRATFYLWPIGWFSVFPISIAFPLKTPKNALCHFLRKKL